MEINTVGDLQRLLSRFDPELPIRKSSMFSGLYQIIPFTSRFEYRIKPAPVIDLPDDDPLPGAYIDAEVDEPGSFNAIIL